MHTKEIAEARRRRSADIKERVILTGVHTALGAGIGSIGGPVTAAVSATVLGATSAVMGVVTLDDPKS